MSVTDVELARAIEQSTAQYDKVRSLDIIYRLGVDAVRDAVQEDEIETEMFATLSPEDQLAYQITLAEQLIENAHSPVYEPTAHERYIDAEIDFDNRTRGLLGQISGNYWFSTIEPHRIWLRTQAYTETTRAGELSMLLLRAHTRGDSVELAKEKRFGRDKQMLQVTEYDRAIVLEAATRLSLVAAHIEAND